MKVSDVLLSVFSLVYVNSPALQNENTLCQARDTCCLKKAKREEKGDLRKRKSW